MRAILINLFACVYVLYQTNIRSYEPESKTIADNTGINVVKVIITDCSPNSTVFDFQSSFVVQRTSCQSNTWTSKCSDLHCVSEKTSL